MTTEETISLFIDTIKAMDQTGDPKEKYRASIYWKSRFFEHNWLSTDGELPDKNDDQLFSLVVDSHFHGKWHTITVIESLVTVEEGWDEAVDSVVGKMFTFGISNCLKTLKESLNEK